MVNAPSRYTVLPLADKQAGGQTGPLRVKLLIWFFMFEHKENSLIFSLYISWHEHTHLKRSKQEDLEIKTGFNFNVTINFDLG